MNQFCVPVFVSVCVSESVSVTACAHDMYVLYTEDLSISESVGPLPGNSSFYSRLSLKILSDQLVHETHDEHSHSNLIGDATRDRRIQLFLDG